MRERNSRNRKITDMAMKVISSLAALIGIIALVSSFLVRETHGQQLQFPAV